MATLPRLVSGPNGMPFWMPPLMMQLPPHPQERDAFIGQYNMYMMNQAASQGMHPMMLWEQMRQQAMMAAAQQQQMGGGGNMPHPGSHDGFQQQQQQQQQQATRRR